LRSTAASRSRTSTYPSPIFEETEQDAAKTGQASLFINGIDPGFANDLLPLALAGTCQRLEQVRCMEIINYDSYDSARR
jgi:hypothetical protein